MNITEVLRAKLKRTFIITVLMGFLVLVVLNPVESEESVSIQSDIPLSAKLKKEDFSASHHNSTVLKATFASEPPNLWDHGVYAVLFLISAALAPRITLLCFAPIQWTIWFVIGASLFPEFTLIFVAFIRGYHRSNYIILGFYCLWKLLSLHYPPGAEQITSRTASFFELLVRTLRNADAMQLLIATQEGINIMKRQMTHLQHRVSLLEMDPNTVKKLTPSQLVQLRDFMRSRLQSLDLLLSNQEETSSTPPLPQDSCVICLTNAPIVKLDPCQHQCMCEECFFECQEREETTCPLCRTPVLNHTFVTKCYTKLIHEQEYHQLGITTTSEELLKLYKYVRENPSELSKLEKCNRKDFEQYM